MPFSSLETGREMTPLQAPSGRPLRGTFGGASTPQSTLGIASQRDLPLPALENGVCVCVCACVCCSGGLLGCQACWTLMSA